MAQKKTPAKRKAVGMQNYGTIDPEFSTRVMRCNLEVSKIRDDKPKTPEEMENTILKYFEICANYHLPPTVEGLGLATHYYRNSLLDIEAGRGRSDFSGIVTWAKNYIKNYDASLAMSGMIPQSVYQFRAKNFYGMKDVQEVTLAPKTDLTPENAHEILKEIPDEL